MLAAARKVSFRKSAVKAARDVPLPAAVLDRLPTPAKVSPDGRDGTLWEGYASMWIYDGRKGFPEHQKGFLKSPARA